MFPWNKVIFISKCKLNPSIENRLRAKGKLIENDLDVSGFSFLCMQSKLPSQRKLSQFFFTTIAEATPSQNIIEHLKMEMKSLEYYFLHS